MSSPDPITAALQAYIDDGALAGAATLIWRDGRVVHAGAVGRRDLTTDLPVERDTIFRIASLTKPVTTVAALALHDAGRFTLDEPIDRYAPELSRMRVLRDPNGPLTNAVPAERPITFGDLLTHRSGLTYGQFHHGPIAYAHAERLGPTIDNALHPDEWIARLGELPLIDHPGRSFHYGLSTDLLGFLLARIEGAPLSDVLAKRVFTPLGMRDTGFTVPPMQRDRRAGLCGFSGAGKPAALTSAPGGQALADRPDAMTFQSGGQGLWSTLDDYLAFARLLLGDGSVDGVRVLQPATCAMMTRNQLTAEQRQRAEMFGRRLFATGHGYGMGVAVVTDPATADPMTCCGGIGTVGWPGAYGGWWQVDPTNQSVMILLAHNMVELEQMMRGIGLGVWEAIGTFWEMGSSAASLP